MSHLNRGESFKHSSKSSLTVIFPRHDTARLWMNLCGGFNAPNRRFYSWSEPVSLQMLGCRTPCARSGPLCHTEHDSSPRMNERSEEGKKRFYLWRRGGRCCCCRELPCKVFLEDKERFFMIDTDRCSNMNKISASGRQLIGCFFPRVPTRVLLSHSFSTHTHTQTRSNPNRTSISGFLTHGNWFSDCTKWQGSHWRYILG